ncbi:hypothetical protein FS842_004009 [Serendipita sp. 407]|nr:hypothetical protein FS842_004009 [Serendipita sp. 407]
MSGGSWAPDLKPLNTMATVERTSLNDDNPPAVLSIREPNNFDVRFASLRNADLVNMAEAGTSPATALKRGHIRATVRFRKDLKNVNKDVSFALLLTSSTPKKHSTLFSSQDNTQSHKSKRLECIFPGSTKRLPNVGDVIELALNSPTILNSTNMASFPFKLKFDTVIMRIIPTAANDVEVQETSPKAPETTIQGSASTLMNRKEGITSLLKPENSAVPSFQKEAPPPLVPVENSIPLESRVIQPNLRIEPKTHHPDTVPTDASTTKLLQKEPTKKSMSHKGLAKKNRHQLQKTAEDILRRGQKQLQVEPQSRTSHQRRRSQGENTSPSSLLPLNIVNESVPKKKLAKQVVKAFSKSLPSTAILDDEELGPKDMSTKFSQSEVRVDHSSTKLNDDQMANPLTVDMLLEWEEEMTTGDTIEPIDDQIADIDEFYDLPEDTIRDEPMVDASQVEDPDQMVYMVQMDTFGTAKMLTIGKYYKIKNMKVDVFRGQLQAKMGWEGDFIMLTERDADGNPELRRLLERKAAFERQEESIEIETSPVGEVRYGNPKYSLEAHTSDDPVSIQGSFASQRLVCKSTAPLRTFAQLYSTVHPVESRIRARVIEFLPRDHQDMVTAHCKRCQS